MDDTVTMKIDSKVKAALDIFAAKWLAKEGKSLTNTEAIKELLRQVDIESLRVAGIETDNGQDNKHA